MAAALLASVYSVNECLLFFRVYHFLMERRVERKKCARVRVRWCCLCHCHYCHSRGPADGPSSSCWSGRCQFCMSFRWRAFALQLQQLRACMAAKLWISSDVATLLRKLPVSITEFRPDSMPQSYKSHPPTLAVPLTFDFALAPSLSQPHTGTHTPERVRHCRSPHFLFLSPSRCISCSGAQESRQQKVQAARAQTHKPSPSLPSLFSTVRGRFVLSLFSATHAPVSVGGSL